MKRNREITRLTAEKYAAKESVRLLSSGLGKYWKRVMGLYISGVLHLVIEKKNDPSVGIATRETYLVFRHIDDLLDGDIDLGTDPASSSPVAVVRRIQNEIINPRGDSYQPHHISEMARYSLQILEPRAKEGENIQQLFTQAIDLMVFDYRRRQVPRSELKALTKQELEQYYFAAFQPVLNLMFIGIGSELRVTPETLRDLALCQGHIYSIRDLEDDWNNQIINIPKEVLAVAGLTPQSSYADVVQNRYVRNWIRTEILTQRRKLKALQAEVRRSQEKYTYKVVNIALINHMFSVLKQVGQKFS